MIFLTWDIRIKRVLYDRYDLNSINWQFPEEEISRQESFKSAESPINFEVALGHAMHSFIYEPGKGELGIRDLVDYRFIDLQGPQWIVEACALFCKSGYPVSDFLGTGLPGRT